MSPGRPAAPAWRQGMIFIWRGPQKESCPVSICPDPIHAWPAGRPGLANSSDPGNGEKPLNSLCFEPSGSQNGPRRRLGLRRLWRLAGLSLGLWPRKEIMPCLLAGRPREKSMHVEIYFSPAAKRKSCPVSRPAGRAPMETGHDFFWRKIMLALFFAQTLEP